MASTVAEVRARTNGEITLPSGLVVAYRRVQARDFLGLGELPVPQSAEDGSVAPLTTEELRERQRQVQRYTDHAIAACVRAPRMSDACDAHGAPLYSDQWVHVSELEEDDYQALSLALMGRDNAGLTPEVAAAVDTFRDDAIGPVGEGHGPIVPRAPIAALTV